MSTKTSFKRIALVAVAALGMGVLTSVAPATAATGNITPTVGTTKGSASTTATTVTGIVGGLVAFTFVNGDDVDYSFSTDGKSTIVSATSTGTNQPAKVNGSTFADGASWNADDSSETATVTLTSSTAGTSIVSLAKTDGSTGVKTTFGTVTITWVSATTLDLASIQVSTLPGNDSANCTVANAANAAHNSVTSVPASDQTNSAAEDADLCVIALNGAGAAKTGVSISVAVDGVGLIGGAAVASSSADADGLYQGDITGSLVAGAGKFVVTVTSTNGDGTTTTTKTASVSVNFRSATASSIVLTQTVGALDEGSAATTVATYVIKDAKANIIAGGSTGALLADSDIASTTTIDVAGEEDASAAVAVGSALTVTALGAATSGTGTITVDCASTTYEKIDIWMQLESDAVKSNKITVYCTQAVGDVTTESLSITAVDGKAGAAQKVKVTVLAGLTGYASYPVADAAAGSAVTLSSSGGSFSTTTPAIVGGVAEADLYAGAIAGDYSITATMGTATATKTVKVTGGAFDSLTTLVNSLLKKINSMQLLLNKIQKKLGVK